MMRIKKMKIKFNNKTCNNMIIKILNLIYNLKYKVYKRIKLILITVFKISKHNNKVNNQLFKTKKILSNKQNFN